MLFTNQFTRLKSLVLLACACLTGTVLYVISIISEPYSFILI
jgi:hypothetical protein